MDRTVAVQTKGWGFSFQAFKNSLMAANRSGDADEGAVTKALAVRFAKPSFHQIEPTRTRRHKVAAETTMALEPAPHAGMGVDPLIIHGQVQGCWPGEFGVQTFKELQELLVPVPRIALTDHLSRAFQQAGSRCLPFVGFARIK